MTYRPSRRLERDIGEAHIAKLKAETKEIKARLRWAVLGAVIG